MALASDKMYAYDPPTTQGEDHQRGNYLSKSYGFSHGKEDL